MTHLSEMVNAQGVWWKSKVNHYKVCLVLCQHDGLCLEISFHHRKVGSWFRFVPFWQLREARECFCHHGHVIIVASCSLPGAYVVTQTMNITWVEWLLSVCLLHHQWFRSSFVCRQSAHLPQVKKYDLAVLLLLSSTFVCRPPVISKWEGYQTQVIDLWQRRHSLQEKSQRMCCFILCGMWKTARGPIPPKCPVIVNHPSEVGEFMSSQNLETVFLPMQIFHGMFFQILKSFLCILVWHWLVFELHWHAKCLH